MDKRTRSFFAIALLGIGVWIWGCGETPIYPGPAFKGEKIAEVKGTVLRFARYYVHTTIVRVDDQAVPWLNRKKIKVGPGPHRIYVVSSAVHMDFDLPNHYREIEFSAKGNHQYEVKSEFSLNRWYVWVEDLETGDVVGGEKPPGKEAPSYLLQ